MQDIINQFWSWKVPHCSEIKFSNEFGNIIFLVQTGAYWRICPEELKAEEIAQDDEAFQALLEDEKFCEDWNMDFLCQVASDALGPINQEQCYGFKVWPAFKDGQYDNKNMELKNFEDWLAQSGEVAEQFSQAKEGQEITLDFD